jgi:hypothetical protein
MATPKRPGLRTVLAKPTYQRLFTAQTQALVEPAEGPQQQLGKVRLLCHPARNCSLHRQSCQTMQCFEQIPGRVRLNAKPAQSYQAVIEALLTLECARDRQRCTGLFVRFSSQNSSAFVASRCQLLPVAAT